VAAILTIVARKSARRSFPSISKRERMNTNRKGEEAKRTRGGKVGRRRKGKVKPARPAPESR